MAAGLTFKVGADTTALGKGLRRAGGMINKFGAATKRLGMVGLAAGTAVATAALAVLATAARGLKSALDLGGRLSDVAANTGLLAGQALILERAFKDAGLGGEKLQPTITKMQRSIVEGGEGLETYAKAFRAIGLSTEDLMEMKPAEQFAAIQQAISGLSSPAERSARAMQIFGKSGAELGALFANGDALGNAAASVGLQADILNRNAGSFDRASDLLGGAGDKLQGFFVGMASYLTPVLLPVLEQLNKVDMAGWGQTAGRLAGTAVMVMKAGQALSMAGLAVKIALSEGVNGVAKTLAQAAVLIGSTIGGSLALAWSKVMDLGFWKGVVGLLKAGADYLRGAAYAIAASWHGEQYQSTADTLKRNAGFDADRAMEKMGSAGSGRTFSDILTDAAQNAQDAFEYTTLIDTSDMKAELKSGWDGFGQVFDEKIDKFRDAKEDGNGGAGANGLTSSLARAVVGFIKPQVTALQRVGGGSIGGVAMNMDGERNRLLHKIERNTSKPNIAVYG